MKVDAKTFQELVTTLEQQGDLLTVTQATAGRPQRHYRLLGETSVEV
jgi:predicted ArsR family transcriptional regulator